MFYFLIFFGMFEVGFIVGGLIFLWLDEEFKVLILSLTWWCPHLRKYLYFLHRIKEQNAPRFSAQQIISFVNIAPEKWSYDKCYDPFYKIYYREKWDNHLVGTKTFFDYWRVISYLKKKEKRKNQKKRIAEVTNNTIELISCFKKDAANAQAEAERLMQEEEDNLMKTLNRIEKWGNTMNGT